MDLKNIIQEKANGFVSKCLGGLEQDRILFAKQITRDQDVTNDVWYFQNYEYSLVEWSPENSADTTEQVVAGSYRKKLLTGAVAEKLTLTKVDDIWDQWAQRMEWEQKQGANAFRELRNGNIILRTFELLPNGGLEVTEYDCVTLESCPIYGMTKGGADGTIEEVFHFNEDPKTYRIGDAPELFFDDLTATAVYTPTATGIDVIPTIAADPDSLAISDKILITVIGQDKANEKAISLKTAEITDGETYSLVASDGWSYAISASYEYAPGAYRVFSFEKGLEKTTVVLKQPLSTTKGE